MFCAWKEVCCLYLVVLPSDDSLLVDFKYPATEDMVSLEGHQFRSEMVPGFHYSLCSLSCQPITERERERERERGVRGRVGRDRRAQKGGREGVPDRQTQHRTSRKNK